MLHHLCIPEVSVAVQVFQLGSLSHPLDAVDQGSALGAGQKTERIFREAGHAELFGDEAAQAVSSSVRDIW